MVAAARTETGLRRAAWLGLYACAASIALLAMQALAAGRLELTFDEAYYTLWSRSLSFGYLDHPPMVALLIRASTSLFGDSEFGVRALSLLVVGAMPALIAFIAWRLFGSAEKAALAALMWIAMPLVSIGALFVTPDAPLVVFWTLGLGALVELWRTGQRRWLIALGLALGLALQSKFTAAFFAAGVVLALVATPSLRRWLVSPALLCGPRRRAHDLRPVRRLERRARLGDLRQATRPRGRKRIHALLFGRIHRCADRADQSARFRRARARGRSHPLARAPSRLVRATKPGAFSSARSRPRRSISFCIRFTTACRATGSLRSILRSRFWPPTGSPRFAAAMFQASPQRIAKAAPWAAPIGLVVAALTFAETMTGAVPLGAANPLARLEGFRGLARDLDAKARADNAAYVLTQGYALTSLMTYYGDPADRRRAAGAAYAVDIRAPTARNAVRRARARARRTGPPFRPDLEDALSQGRAGRPFATAPGRRDARGLRALPGRRSLRAGSGPGVPSRRGQSSAAMPIVSGPRYPARASGVNQPNRRSMIPARMTSTAIARCRWNGSPSATIPMIAANTTDVSRRAATAAIGARVIAQMTIA